MLGWHLEGPNAALLYAQDAVTYAKEAKDNVLLLSALDYLTWLYYYSNRSKQAQDTIQQTLPLLKKYKASLPSRLIGGIYSTVAVMQSKNGQQAATPLRQAVEAFFNGQKEEHRIVYIDYTEGALLLNDGMVHYQLGDYEKALDSLSQLIDPETLALKRFTLPERSRVEGLNLMTLASLKSQKKDRERILFFWQAAVQGANALQSEQRFQEALLSYEIMQSVWPGEKRIAELRALTLHW
jgi:tetratricopeptide (TPR) repeat protein